MCESKSLTIGEYPLVNAPLAGECFALAFLQRGAQGIETAKEQIFLVVEVGVERRAADIRVINDVLNRKFFKTFLLDQREERFPKKFVRALYSPVPIRCHLTFPVSEQFGLV